MKMLTLANRNIKEIVRDPLTIFFSLGFPLIVLFLLYAIQQNIPVSIFETSSLAPAITIFGLSFMTLFSATLLSKDRESALLQRLYTTPLTASDFIFAYFLPIIPISVLQAFITIVVSFFLGLKVCLGSFLVVLFIIPNSIFFISMGLIFGSILNVKAVGGISGAFFTNLCAWLSGIWFDVELVGGAFEKIANALPFIHAVNIQRAVYNLDFASCITDLYWILGYGVVALGLSIFLFLRQMKKN